MNEEKQFENTVEVKCTSTKDSRERMKILVEKFLKKADVKTINAYRALTMTLEAKIRRLEQKYKADVVEAENRGINFHNNKCSDEVKNQQIIDFEDGINYALTKKNLFLKCTGCNTEDSIAWHCNSCAFDLSSKSMLELQEKYENIRRLIVFHNNKQILNCWNIKPRVIFLDEGSTLKIDLKEREGE